MNMVNCGGWGGGGGMCCAGDPLFHLSKVVPYIDTTFKHRCCSSDSIALLSSPKILILSVLGNPRWSWSAGHIVCVSYFVHPEFPSFFTFIGQFPRPSFSFIGCSLAPIFGLDCSTPPSTYDISVPNPYPPPPPPPRGIFPSQKLAKENNYEGGTMSPSPHLRNPKQGCPFSGNRMLIPLLYCILQCFHNTLHCFIFDEMDKEYIWEIPH